MKQLRPFVGPLHQAFTLIEILMVIAVISTAVAGTIFTISNVTRVAKTTKLQRDVAVINNAIRTYTLNGGTFLSSDLASPATVLVKLKKHADADSAKEVAGLRDSMADKRLTFILQTSVEASDKEERARFIPDPLNPRFVVQSEGPAGIREFVMDSRLSDQDFGEEKRTASLKLAKQDPWVWDYQDNIMGGASRKNLPLAADPGVNAPAGTPEVTLTPPSLSIVPGAYSLSSYPMTVTLIDSNFPGTSRILVSKNAQPWTVYTSAMTILPSDAIIAYAESLDHEACEDSASTTGQYTAHKVTLVAGDTFPGSLRYPDLGGLLAAGSILPAQGTPPKLLLMNGDELPDYWENHTVFQMFWTQNGTDPRVVGPSRKPGNDVFEIHYPGDEVPLQLSDFPSPSLTLKYYAGSKNENAVISSSVGQRVIARAKTPLLPPIVTPDDRSLYGEDPVAMFLNTTGGQTPAGARIFYRTDGTDPGDANGEPAITAIHYNGTFLPTPDLGPVVAIVARVYPPSGYKDWFVTSPPVTQSYFLPYGDKNIYAVQKVDQSLYVVDAATGVSQVINTSAPFVPYTLALDGPGAMLYYVEAGGSNWRLGRYDIIGRTHTILGGLGSGRAYNATLLPENLAFYNGAIYYVNRKTDDLIRVTVSGNSITEATRVADMSGNTKTFDKIGDLAVDENGWMYFNASDKKYYRYDLNTMSGLKQLGDTERDYEALAIYRGRLYAGDDGSDELRRVAPSTGNTLSKIKTLPLKRFVDFAAPSPVVSMITGSSIWTITDTQEGPHLHEIRNYRNPVMAADIDYGILYFLDGTSPKAMVSNGKSDIEGMCITNTGMLYFSRNYKTHVAGKDYFRPILRLNLSTLVLGDVPNASFVGDMKNGLAAFAGTIDPDDDVTGLTLSPGGHLYGILREGASTGPGSEDYLFRITQTAAAMTGPHLGVTLVGRPISAAGACTQSEDLCFAPDGSLYASDTASKAIFRLDPNNGSVLSVLSAETGSEYHALAVDPSDYRVIACNYSGAQANALMQVGGGAGNDIELVNLNNLFGHTEIEAATFFQGPFILSTDPPDLYAADGTETIYGLDFDTGSTVPFSEAPYRVKALAYDFNNRRLYYLENNAALMSVGSYNFSTSTHQPQGNLKGRGFTYEPAELPDNLCYFGGFLWHVPPHSDDLVKVELNADGAVIAQTRAANLTGDTLSFDLTGDLAVAPDGWMYFTTIRFDGQRFCRFKLTTMNGFEVLGGPTPPPAVITSDETYKEKWFDALAFRTVDSTGARPLFGTYASAPSPLRTVSTLDGDSSSYKPTIPAIRIIDFSDFHPGTLGAGGAVKPQPVLAFANLRPAYSYADVGGSFVPGINPPPDLAPAPAIILANANEVPLSMQNSSHFTVKWTCDGQNPKTATSGVSTGPAFTNGMPTMPAALDFAKWQGRTTLPVSALAVSEQPQVINDSPILTASVPIQKMQLRDPVFAESTTPTGQRQLSILPSVDAGDCPPGTRIYYTSNSSDPGITIDASGDEVAAAGTLYTGPFDIPTSLPFGQGFLVTARIYPPQGLSAWFTSSIADYYDVPLGLAGGHMDVDTAHLLYPFRKGSTDGHVHEYDKKFNVVGESFFNFKTSTLKNIPVYVANGVRFKIIVANADLSPGGRLVINNVYNSGNSSTYVKVTDYDNTLPAALPVYSLDGVPGTIKLTELALYFDSSVIAAGGLIGTVTGAVRSNTPGKLGEWRNGALTIQLVRVNADDTPAFTTNLTLSNGSVQGAATSGLLWETTFFWHHRGVSYDRL